MSSEKKKSYWISLGVAFGVGGLAGAIGIGLKQSSGLWQLAGIVLEALVTAVITGVVAYLLLDRDRRKKEREANLVVVGLLYKLRASLLLFGEAFKYEELLSGHGYEKGTDPVLRDGSFQLFSMFMNDDGEMDEEGEGFVLPSDFDLREFLLEVRGLPYAWKEGLAKLERLDEEVESIRQLIASCETRFATHLPMFLDSVGDTKGVLETPMERGIRAYERLIQMHQLRALDYVTEDEAWGLVRRMYLAHRALYIDHETYIQSHDESDFAGLQEYWSSVEVEKYQEYVDNYDKLLFE